MAGLAGASRHGLGRSEAPGLARPAPGFQKSAGPEKSVKKLFSGTSKSHPNSNEPKSLIPMQQKLGLLLHFPHPNEDSQCHMPTSRPPGLWRAEHLVAHNYYKYFGKQWDFMKIQENQ